MVNTQYNGTLYFNDQFDKFKSNKNSLLRYTQHHDIRVGTQAKRDGSPLALTVEVANPGKLALDEDTFQRQGEPKLSAKVNYNGIQNEDLPRVINNLVGLFNVKQCLGENEAYTAINDNMPYKITKDEYHSLDYVF